MKHSFKMGFSFGSTSGVITTLGLIVGLHSGTHSKIAVLGGILTIAIADAFSDALGIHVSEESEGKHTVLEVWESTIATFISKFVTAITFVIPFIILSFEKAVIASVIWGFLLLAYCNFHMAKTQKIDKWKLVMEHVMIAVIVILIAHFTGDMINRILK